MSLRPNINRVAIRSYIEGRIANFKDAMMTRLQQAGEKFINLARDKRADEGGFNDVTGNLRSSIGYMIIHNGVVIREAFPTVLNGSLGSTKGKQLALSEAPQQGYCLICVAGMDYAAAVESRGKDVVTGSSQLVKNWLNQALTRLKNKI